MPKSIIWYGTEKMCFMLVQAISAKVLDNQLTRKQNCILNFKFYGIWQIFFPSLSTLRSNLAASLMVKLFLVRCLVKVQVSSKNLIRTFAWYYHFNTQCLYFPWYQKHRGACANGRYIICFGVVYNILYSIYSILVLQTWNWKVNYNPRLKEKSVTLKYIWFKFSISMLRFFSNHYKMRPICYILSNLFFSMVFSAFEIKSVNDYKN